MSLAVLILDKPSTDQPSFQTTLNTICLFSEVVVFNDVWVSHACMLNFLAISFKIIFTGEVRFKGAARGDAVLPQRMYTGSFNGIKHARNFASKHSSGGGYNSREKSSATWTPSGVGGRAKVTIEKTGAAYKLILATYEGHQRELKCLEPLLGDLSGSGGEGPLTKKKEAGN